MGDPVLSLEDRPSARLRVWPPSGIRGERKPWKSTQPPDSTPQRRTGETKSSFQRHENSIARSQHSLKYQLRSTSATRIDPKEVAVSPRPTDSEDRWLGPSGSGPIRLTSARTSENEPASVKAGDVGFEAVEPRISAEGTEADPPLLVGFGQKGYQSLGEWPAPHGRAFAVAPKALQFQG